MGQASFDGTWTVGSIVAWPFFVFRASEDGEEAGSMCRASSNANCIRNASFSYQRDFIEVT